MTKNFLNTLTLLIVTLMTLTLTARAADNIIVPGGTAGTTGQSFLRGADGKLYPAMVVYTTDGNGNLTPIASSISNITIGTVNQGTNNDGTHPWHVIDDTFITDFDTWKVWADVNLSTRASEATLSLLNGKVTNTTGGAIKVDGSSFTQPVSGTVAVSNFPATQTVSGTVTANIGTSGGLALDTTLSALSAKFNSLGQKTEIGSAPVVIASDQSAIPVSQSGSWSVTANAGTGNFTVVQATGSNLHSVVDSGTVTANIGTTNGLALDATVSSVQATTGAAVPSKGNLSEGKDNLGNAQPLSVTTAGKLNIEGGNATAVKVDGSAVTQPVSGTVAATQSGNWNMRLDDGNGNVVTSQLSGAQRALDVGVNVSGVQVDPRAIRALTSADQVTAVQGSSATLTGAWPIKVTDSVGANAATVKAASTAAAAADPSFVVALSPNSPLPTGSNTIGALTANQSVNMAQVAGTNTVTGGASGLMAVGGNVASGATDSANPVKVGGVFNTTAPTLTNGQRGDLQLSSRGAAIVAGASADGVAPINNAIHVAGVDPGGLKRTFLTDTSGRVTNSNNSSYANITTATTTTVKSGAGVLFAICYNTQVNNATITIYDNTTAATPTIGKITETLGGGADAPFGCSQYGGLAFSTGLTIVTSAAVDITVLYK